MSLKIRKIIGRDELLGGVLGACANLFYVNPSLVRLGFLVCFVISPHLSLLAYVLGFYLLRNQRWDRMIDCLVEASDGMLTHAAAEALMVIAAVIVALQYIVISVLLF